MSEGDSSREISFTEAVSGLSQRRETNRQAFAASPRGASQGELATAELRLPATSCRSSRTTPMRFDLLGMLARRRGTMPQALHCSTRGRARPLCLPISHHRGKYCG